MQNLSVGLDPRTLAQVQIMRSATLNARDALKVLGVSDMEAFIKKELDLGTRRSLPTALRRAAKKSETLGEFTAALNVVQQAYLMVYGPTGKVLLDIADKNGTRWFDNQLMKSLKRHV